MTWADLSPLGVELVLLVGALSLLGVDLILPPGEKRVLGWGTLALLVVALASTWILPLDGLTLSGAYEGHALGIAFKRIFLTSGLLAVLAQLRYGQEVFPRRQGEYFQLLLYSLVGMCLLSGARDLVVLAVAFELMGIPLYAMAGYRRRNRAASEGALKLYMTGAVSTITTLYGLSLLFGATGSTAIAEVARQAAVDPSPLLFLGGAVAVAGMGFKIGVVPFHMWVPDTYQGVPTPFVVFLAAGPKAAGIAALVQVLLPGDAALLQVVLEVLLVVAAVTITLGTLLALPQGNVKRLLGYSGIAHMGFLLMGLATGESEGLATLLFYLLGYLFTNAGAFLVVHAVRQDGGDDTVRSFDGLGRRSYWLGMSMLLFLLSLGGIPFVVGFWAKLYVFLAAWRAGFAWLVVLGALVSVVSLFYYLRVARAMFMNRPRTGEPVALDGATRLAIVTCLVFVMAMGLWPGPFIDAARSAAVAFLG